MMGARRISVRLTDEEKWLIDLVRSAEPLPPPVSHAVRQLAAFSRGEVIPEIVEGDLSSARLFQIGDVVQLRSGGHLMSVIDVGPACGVDGEAVTVMWSADSDRRSGLAGPALPARSIPPACLKIVDPDIPF
ncbi:DUF2158 domain-containing protein [Bosea sp. (in: a-proteobacteria)]|uniref:DUF2158 domain-containing protein n=1 Tax=Bosea sp. (in: a-proteobacteria) TaxID=1871050 RepID=UPI0026101A9A|nr:DUF2158 domain-containing protein [Bosea sp. (in: a-proteobacteria)]MCO5091978.1 YodC family protein [Bosea sp. (in: a-proteobacteria)]